MALGEKLAILVIVKFLANIDDGECAVDRNGARDAGGGGFSWEARPGDDLGQRTA